MHLKTLAAAFLTVFTFTAAAQWADKPITRPRITGISHIAVYTSDPAATDHYYTEIIGALKLPDPENPKGVKYALSATQYIEVLPLPPDAAVNRLDHTAWNTDDAEALRRYLGSKSWKVPGQVEKGTDESRWFAVKDPEGNKVVFVQLPERRQQLNLPAAVGTHIIHVGFLVHSRAVEDTFYRDLLGFKPYWYGGMVEGKLDWVSQQAPDSHDWLEYMLTIGPSGSGVPANYTQQQLGVQDHLSIGVISVDMAYRKLEEGNRLTGHQDQHTVIGKDGKGQFNLYDPDGIRLELMNFHASQKPCCSPFTAEDPSE
jgi:catechol 2,3-dioxygenase-like lactoylglutathione lyase family enzyme